MEKMFILLTGSLVGAMCSNPGHAEPINLADVRQMLVSYHDSGEYTKELSEVAHKAQKFLAQRIKQNNTSKTPKKLAIVFDVDETTLSNYASMKSLRFGGKLSDFEQDLEKAEDLPIKPVLALYRFAANHNVTPFFVTARKEKERTVTEKNLSRAGYQHWQEIYFKPNSYNQTSNVPYKVSARTQIEKQGYTIVANVGDQKSDLIGGHSERGFKLPNPFYRIP